MYRKHLLPLCGLLLALGCSSDARECEADSECPTGERCVMYDEIDSKCEDGSGRLETCYPDAQYGDSCIDPLQCVRTGRTSSGDRYQCLNPDDPDDQAVIMMGSAGSGTGGSSGSGSGGSGGGTGGSGGSSAVGMSDQMGPACNTSSANWNCRDCEAEGAGNNPFGLGTDDPQVWTQCAAACTYYDASYHADAAGDDAQAMITQAINAACTNLGAYEPAYEAACEYCP